ncbi:MAG: mechanosensitive ion channel [Verrucomicrobia bacterium]|nr:mechanosensitive ion channel [Verrucomicrobiota bacterium]
MKDTVNTLSTVQTTVLNFFVEYGFKIFGALIILVVGLLIARWIGRLVLKQLEKYHLEPPVRLLMVRIIKLLIMGLTGVIAVQKLGVEVMPLVAGLGVAGVGVGLAMQGVLSNVVAGLTIIFTKPFRVGEYVELVGVHGQVEAIELFSTTLLHTDLSRVVIPNRKIVGEILHNYARVRQLDLTVGVSYDSDLNAVIATVRELLAKHPKVLKDPAPVVGVTLLADSAINIAVKPWVAVENYIPAQAELYQAIVDQFRARRIEIPFPQREVRVLNGSRQTTAA